MPDSGFLVIRASAARDAVPVIGASVTVCPMDDGSRCIRVRTDMSGRTEQIELDAPSLDGMSPAQSPPYASYRVDIDHPEYRPVTVNNVPIFAGVTSTLPVILTPPRTVEQQTQRIIINSGETGPSGSGTEGK